MTPFRARLSESDIRRLIKADDDDDRAAAAHKLCRAIDKADHAETLTDEEREAAQKILRVLAADAAELVRRALAVTLKSSDLLPREVARKLAADVDSIALPVLASSPMMTDADLIEIVRGGSGARQIAIAGRPFVSRDVGEAIAADGVEAAVRVLASNDNADLSEAALGKAIDRFGQSPAVVTALAYRKVLPLAVTEKLIALASDAVRDHLISQHAIAPETAIRLAVGTRERATVDLIDQAGREPDIAAFVANLHARKVLNGSLLLRAVARGQMSFFEHAMAVLAGTPHQRAWLMIHDGGPLGLKAIYDRAGLPPRLYAAFRSGVDTWRALQSEGGDPSPERFQQRMLERFLSERSTVPRDDLGYLLDRLDQAPDRAGLVQAANAA